MVSRAAEEATVKNIRPVRTEPAYDEKFDIFLREGKTPHPEEIGTYVLIPFKIVGYIKDYQGTQYAELIQVDRYGGDVHDPYKGVVLNPNQHLVVKHPSLLWIPGTE